MRRALFIDRDGTLIREPEDEQIDSLEKLEYLPGVFRYLGRIAQEFDYELVMVSNQDGLGTDSFPEETFWPAQNKMLKTLEGEGVVFDDILIDPSFPEDSSPNRKPCTGMLTSYMGGRYDLKNSVVIGDRESDVELARNLGARAIRLLEELEVSTQDGRTRISPDWKDVYQTLRSWSRESEVIRTTKETSIQVELLLDGDGWSDISTGIGFLDHMLDQVAFHGGLDLGVKADGDTWIDEHHTIEDVALTLGTAFKEALRNKVGLVRYGFSLPMDDALANVAVDVSGRPWVVWDVELKREKIGDFPTEMFYHFFKSLSDTSGFTINVKATGDNEHHKVEAIFKAFGRAVREAVRVGEGTAVPSTKGVLA